MHSMPFEVEEFNSTWDIINMSQYHLSNHHLIKLTMTNTTQNLEMETRLKVPIKNVMNWILGPVHRTRARRQNVPITNTRHRILKAELWMQMTLSLPDNAKLSRDDECRAYTIYFYTASDASVSVKIEYIIFKIPTSRAGTVVIYRGYMPDLFSVSIISE